MSKWIRQGTLPALSLLCVLASGCGDLTQQGRSPGLATVTLLEAASGAQPQGYGGTLSSDVVTNVKKTVNGVEVRVPTLFSDPGRAMVSVELKNPNSTGPTDLNNVTFTRYRVTYTRADGRNTPGIDVPYSFDSAVTFTVAPGTSTQTGFELVRVIAKSEAPLVDLVKTQDFITVIAQVTFYGSDHAGNEVSASGNIGITFGNFGDPD